MFLFYSSFERAAKIVTQLIKASKILNKNNQLNKLPDRIDLNLNASIGYLVYKTNTIFFLIIILD